MKEAQDLKNDLLKSAQNNQNDIINKALKDLNQLKAQVKNIVRAQQNLQKKTTALSRSAPMSKGQRRMQEIAQIPRSERTAEEKLDFHYYRNQERATINRKKNFIKNNTTEGFWGEVNKTLGREKDIKKIQRYEKAKSFVQEYGERNEMKNLISMRDGGKALTDQQSSRLAELESKYAEKDKKAEETKKKNAEKNQKQTKKSTELLGGMNKELAKVTRYMKIFGVAMVAKGLFEKGMSLHQSRANDTVMASRVGLNIQRQRDWQMLAQTAGIDFGEIYQSLDWNRNILTKARNNMLSDAEIELLTNRDPQRGFGFNIADLKRWSPEQLLMAQQDRILSLREKGNIGAADILTNKAMDAGLGMGIGLINLLANMGQDPKKIIEETRGANTRSVAHNAVVGEVQKEWAKTMQKFGELLDRFVASISPLLVTLNRFLQWAVGDTLSQEINKVKNVKTLEELENSGDQYKNFTRSISSFVTRKSKAYYAQEAMYKLALTGNQDAMDALLHANEVAVRGGGKDYFSELVKDREKFGNARSRNRLAGDMEYLLKQNIKHLPQETQEHLLKYIGDFAGFMADTIKGGVAGDSIVLEQAFNSLAMGKNVELNGRLYEGIKGVGSILHNAGGGDIANSSRGTKGDNTIVLNITHNGTKEEVNSDNANVKYSN